MDIDIDKSKMKNNTNSTQGSIPQQIFEKFIEEIQIKGISKEVAQDLRECYKKGELTEIEFKKILIREEEN